MRSLQEVVIGVSAHQHKVLQTLHNAFLNKLEEDVVAALVRLLVSHPRFLKQVDVNEASGQLSHVVEVDPDEFTKPGGVVVPYSFGIAPRLKDGVGLDDLVLKGGLALLPLARGADGGEVGNDLLGVFGLSGTRLSSNLDELVLEKR